MSLPRRIVLLLALAWSVALPVEAQRTWLMVVSGLGGDPEFSDAFYRWSSQLVDAARDAGVPRDQILWLAEDPDRDPDRIRARSEREAVLAALTELAEQSSAGDGVWIVLFGHGSSTGGEPRFNLPGPDLTAADFAAALEPIPARVAFVNTASSSGGFLPLLSADGRAVVTATRSGGQRNQTVFGEHFAAAFVDGRGDLDKSGSVSLLEAFRFARQEATRHYESQGLLVTEHPQLDDNGDRQGSDEPDPLASDATVDGRLAGRFLLVQDGAVAQAADDPELSRLLAEKRELEAQIEELRRQRDSLEEEAYFAELESLMVELARLDREIEGSRGGGDSPEEEP